jgi:hypothetical protein
MSIFVWHLSKILDSPGVCHIIESISSRWSCYYSRWGVYIKKAPTNLQHVCYFSESNASVCGENLSAAYHDYWWPCSSCPSLLGSDRYGYETLPHSYNTCFQSCQLQIIFAKHQHKIMPNVLHGFEQGSGEQTLILHTEPSLGVE